MGKAVSFFIILLVLTKTGMAQYINTDSLVIVPGEEHPLLLSQLDSMQLISPETNFSGNFVTGTDLIIHSGKLLSFFDMPCNGKVISRFGPRSGRMHTGTDIKKNKGDTIYASFGGRVTRAKYYYGYGNMVVVDHGSNIETYYAHLSAFLVKNGETVAKGQPLGLAGATGRATTSHLHYEIRENGKPYDPELVFAFEQGEIRDEVAGSQNLAELHREMRPKGYSVNEPAPEHYVVRSGDSLWKISRRFRVSIKALCALNNLTEQSVLQIGQILKIY